MNISRFSRALIGCTATAAVSLVGLSQSALAVGTAGGSGSSEHVIVIGQDGAGAAVSAAVKAAGGTVTRSLPIINGVAATVPAAAESALRVAPGVKAVTPDASGHLMSVNPSLGYDPAADDGSLNLAEQAIGATTSWTNGYTGKGIDVALIDSGVSPVPGLTSGNVVLGPDLSFDSQDSQLTDMDGFGHGTHMAGIIAGRDVAQPTGAAYAADQSHFYGIAPDARLVPVKVAAADGSADVSQVIAAINWVDQNAHSNGLNIRVLNLSFGTNSTQDYTVDPLAYAAEQAWKHGIVVVVSAGNDGKFTHVLADPAYDPTLLAVGASDVNRTVTQSDDYVASFTNGGSFARHSDVVAPGAHVLSLRDPNSVVDAGNPGAVVGGRFFRGSGTSQAAAVTSGAAALLLQRYPNATPDQVKALLMATAHPLKGNSSSGSGEINVAAAQAAPLPAVPASTVPAATGTGSLDAARGGSYVYDQTGVALNGERDIFGHAWTPAAWTSAVANKAAWDGGSFNGATWTGTGFDSSSWASSVWASSVWASSVWTSSSWTGAAWSSHAWASHAWASSSWTSSSWTDDCWQSSSWASSSWTSSVWASSLWASSTWS